MSKFGKGLNLVIDFINKNYPLPKNKIELTVDSHNINLSDNLFYNLDINFNGNELSVSTEEPLDFKSGLYDEKNPLSYYKKTPIDFKKDKRAFGVFEKETQQFHLKVLDRENEELPNFSGYKAMAYDYVWGSDGVGLKAQFSCNETIYDENLKDVASYEPLKGDPTTTNSVSLFVMDKDSEEVVTNSFYKKSNELIKKINENTVEKATAVLGIRETETCVQ